MYAAEEVLEHVEVKNRLSARNLSHKKGLVRMKLNHLDYMCGYLN